MTGWRILQVFLSSRQPAIYEVELNLDSQEVRCSCPTYKGRKSCRHLKFVKARMDGNDGNYPLMVHETAEAESIEDVMSTPDKFREFVVKYGKVEVI
jgi:hypothetical protein